MLPTRCLVLVAIAAMAGVQSSSPLKKSNGYIPIVIQPTGPVVAGKATTWEIRLNRTVNDGSKQEVRLEGIFPIDFAEIPASVTVPNGSDRVTFDATIASKPRDPSVAIGASMDDGSAESAAVPVILPADGGFGKTMGMGIPWPVRPTSGGYIPIVRLVDPNQTIHSGDTVTWQVVLPDPLAPGKSVVLTVDSDPRIAFTSIPYKLTVAYGDSEDHRTATIETQIDAKFTGSIRLCVADGWSVPVWVGP